MLPSVTTVITATVVQVAVGTAKGVQSRHRANFLDDMKQRPFEAHGFYCLVMIFKPEADRPVSADQVNVSDLIAKL